MAELDSSLLDESRQGAEAALAAADRAFRVWSRTPLAERRGRILAYADLVDQHKDELIELLIAETGTASMGLGFAQMPEKASFHNQTLWGSIGWATPAALGAAMAAPPPRRWRERSSRSISGMLKRRLTHNVPWGMVALIIGIALIALFTWLKPRALPWLQARSTAGHLMLAGAAGALPLVR